MPITRPAGLTIVAVAAAVLLPHLGTPPLWDDDESRNAACSLAMRATGDWVVPTVDGRLRVEKPALVNWLQLAGFAVAGVNETGARLASAVLTIVSCLLTAVAAGRMFRPAVGLWAGVVMATCLWTGIGGRAATPDAALVFGTTLALWMFVRGCGLPTAAPGGWLDGPVNLSRGGAIGVGGGCGLAMLAKGPVGLVLPLLGIASFCLWQAARDPGRVGSRTTRLVAAARAALRSLRLPIVCGAAAAVALPWYAAVTVRTEGDWLREFVLVHNVGRFAAAMEGHSGPAILYFPVVLLLGTFPWSIASALVIHHAAGRTATSPGMRLAVCWIAAWVVPFSLSATKLPGYVWPAYPAVAAAVAHFAVDWVRRPTPATDRWMRVAWIILAASGAALAVGLPMATRRFAPGAGWLGLIGLVPITGAVAAWICQSVASRTAATATWAATAAATAALLVAAGPTAASRAGGARDLVEPHFGPALEGVSLATFETPASVSFYAGRLVEGGAVTRLAAPAEAAAFVSNNPRAHLVVDARYERATTAALPDGYGVLRSATAFPSGRRLLLLGPRDPLCGRLAAVPDDAPR